MVCYISLFNSAIRLSPLICWTDYIHVYTYICRTLLKCLQRLWRLILSLSGKPGRLLYNWICKISKSLVSTWATQLVSRLFGSTMVCMTSYMSYICSLNHWFVRFLIDWCEKVIIVFCLITGVMLNCDVSWDTFSELMAVN